MAAESPRAAALRLLALGQRSTRPPESMAMHVSRGRVRGANRLKLRTETLKKAIHSETLWPVFRWASRILV
ncbi:hypothetical protein Q1695_014510 [Nippostrongylus brasiliensis]|nr:hypothetical protein Q1695_014510 [Nippostrongylus brasiliensis]